MRKKVLLVSLAMLTVVALILASCTAPEDEEPGQTITVTGKITLPPEREKQEEEEVYSEKPQYGGSGIGRLAADIPGFDEAFIQHYAATSLHLTNEELLQGDWTKGPAGTGETDWVIGGINYMAFKAGALADSWEMPEKGKMIFHIREGVYWHNKAPTNGRELTVEDVVYSINRMCTNPGAYIKITYPATAKGIKIISDEATRTVTLDTTSLPSSEWANVLVFCDYLSIMPKDALEYFKDNMNDWRNSIGTGPFMLTDYVSNGSATFTRNPNYWMTNPIGPGKGDQLPYLDAVKLLVITDTATAMTAMRTMKINGISGQYDDMKEFVDNPEIKRLVYTAEACGAIFMRTDKADLPFSKLEVRQALMMATDFVKIRDEFYDGKATILAFPIAYTKEYKDAYIPMENLPANVQELFSHNVDKAKELLDKAGYSTGFTTSITFYSGSAPTTDYLSLIQSMWSDVGVTLNLDGRDYNTWVARIRARNFNELFYYGSSGNWQKFQSESGTSTFNLSYVNDELVNEALARSLEYIGWDEAAVAKNFADMVPYILEQSWVIPTPLPYTYVCWWPWIKGWNGELSVGYYNTPNYYKYQWIDQDLKREITNR